MSDDYYTSQGIIKLDYKGRVIEVPFSLYLYGYGGIPLLGIKDKNEHHHSFVRGTYNGWHANGVEPKWPKEFLALLYDAAEIEYMSLKKTSSKQVVKIPNGYTSQEYKEARGKTKE